MVRPATRASDAGFGPGAAHRARGLRRDRGTGHRTALAPLGLRRPQTAPAAYVIQILLSAALFGFFFLSTLYLPFSATGR